MINIESYILSGVLEDYCLGILSDVQAQAVEDMCDQYPEINARRLELQDNLLQIATQHAVTPPDNSLEKIFDEFDVDSMLEEVYLDSHSQSINKFVPISRNTNHEKWNSIVTPIYPPDDFDIHSHLLYDGIEGKLIVVWIKAELPEELHYDITEKILILEGHCTGYIEDRALDLVPGSFVEVPKNKTHSLLVESPSPAKLLVWRQQVA